MAVWLAILSALLVGGVVRAPQLRTCLQVGWNGFGACIVQDVLSVPVREPFAQPPVQALKKQDPAPEPSPETNSNTPMAPNIPAPPDDEIREKVPMPAPRKGQPFDETILST